MYRRNELVDYIINRIQTIPLDDPLDVYTQDYRFVTRDPIDVGIAQKLQAGEAAVGVYDTAEEKQREFGSTRASLTIVVEFYYRPKTGQSKATYLNIILAELTKRVMTDYSQGSLALNTEEVGNDLDIDGIYDRIVNGSITFEVTYRHGTFDPTRALC